MIYLDNSATTRPFDCVLDKMQEALRACWGNPSSMHRIGIEASRQLETARGLVAAALGAKPFEMVFTSGGTESNNLALAGAALAHAKRGKKIVSTACEHSSVRAVLDRLAGQGFEVVTVPAPGGVLNLSAFEEAVDDKTILVSVMLVNNETGAIFPVSKIKKIIKQRKSPALLHSDCVQAFCRIPFSVQTLGADLVTVSAHKIHGPKGAAALYVKSGVRILPMNLGGNQENGLRCGTESVPSIAGFGEAARVSFENMNENTAKLASLRDHLVSALSTALPCAVLNSPYDGAPHIVNLSLPGLRSEVMLHHLESLGIFVSAGSACSSRSKGLSPVLQAFGISSQCIKSALRISLSHTNTPADIDRLAEGLCDCENKLIKG